MQEKDTTFYKILPNGLKIVHRMSTSEVAYVGFMVGAGTRDEEPTLNGLAHYVEHTVFKGCLTPRGENVTARQIINKIEGIGGEINAYTTKEETTFYAATPVAHYAQTLQLLADMVLRPTFPKQETDKELGVILDEIESYEDSPSELIYDDFENLIFHGHPLGMSILGTKRTLHNISRTPTHALNWVETNYTPDRMVVFSQGKMSFDSVCHQIEKAFESAASRWRLVSRSLKQPVPMVVPSTQTFKRHTHQTHVMLGGLAYPLGHEKQLAAYLLNNILGGGSLNSRLNLSLREQKGLVYTVESQYVPLSDTGYWNVYFACDQSQLETCLSLTHKELKRLQDEKLSSLQLHRAIQQLHGQMAISAENQENNVLAMGKSMLYHNRSLTWQEVFQRIENITSDTLQDVANDLFAENHIFTLFYA